MAVNSISLSVMDLNIRTVILVMTLGTIGGFLIIQSIAVRDRSDGRRRKKCIDMQQNKGPKIAQKYT